MAGHGTERCPLEKCLQDIGLGTLYVRFQEEKNDANMIEMLSDNELSRLGLQTMGDRHRLREQVKSF